MENLNPITIFKDYKESSININKKNDGIDIDKKDIKDDKEDNEDFAINTESIINLNANIINFKEADKSVRETISVLLDKIEKRVNDGNKGTGEVRKEIDDADKGNREIGKEVGDTNIGARYIISDLYEEVRKDVDDYSIKDCISVFFEKVKKGVHNDVLANILVDILENSLDNLDFPLI